MRECTSVWCCLRWSVSCLILSVRRATWTSVDPVSPSCSWKSRMIWDFVSVSIMPPRTFSPLFTLFFGKIIAHRQRARNSFRSCGVSRVLRRRRTLFLGLVARQLGSIPDIGGVPVDGGLAVGIYVLIFSGPVRLLVGVDRAVHGLALRPVREAGIA